MATPRLSLAVVTLLLAPATAAAAAEGAPGRQTQADAYTRYELLDPASASFRIVYDVTATTAGATAYLNPIREGSEPAVHGVTDLATGRPLDWRLVGSEEAAAEGLVEAGAGLEYIRVALARPVPEGGEGRIRIDKTYRDPSSYGVRDGLAVFERALGVERNAVVLPVGYELVGCNHPSQVAMEADGRIRVSFMNRGAAPVPLRIAARPLDAGPPPPAPDGPAAGGAVVPRPATTIEVPSSARLDLEVPERAAQDREIVYFLRQPETHSFRLYHDYTESRPGVDRYLNVVRPGSRASEPSATILDTGAILEVETLRGAEIADRGLDIGEPITEASEVVAIWFDPVAPGESKRLRITETYTDPGRYGLDGDELVWDRSFGRSRNTVVLPPGWYLTASAVPAVVDETDTGEIRLRFDNDRPGAIEVYLRARRRPGPGA